MDTENYIIGFVSNDASNWTMQYEYTGRYSGSRIGYGPSVFENVKFTGPVVRFDRAKLSDVLAWLSGPVRLIAECEYPITNLVHTREVCPLSEYLEIVEKHNIPIEYWQDGKPASHMAGV